MKTMLLGLLFIYFIGKKFYDLAETYNKNKWLFAIAAIATYYGSTFLFGVLTVFVVHLSGDSLDNWSNFSLTIIGIALGILTVVGFYKYLKNIWSKKTFENDEALLDENL